MKDIETMLADAGVKPTSNRILVLQALLQSPRPLSLGELEGVIGTLEKSSILRTLSVLQEHHLIHDVEDGRGVINYEICSGHDSGRDLDMHVHFYCEKCRRLICFEDMPVPEVALPPEFQQKAVNYMVKGICPDCRRRR